MDWRDRSAFGMADLRRVVKTAEGLTCQPKIAAAGSVTLRNGHQRSQTREIRRSVCLWRWWCDQLWPFISGDSVRQPEAQRRAGRPAPGRYRQPLTPRL